MAHNLYGDRIFYTGEKPWHGIGVELDNPATAEEAIAVARLDYDVELEPIQLQSGRIIENKQATVNKDTGECLGIVGDNYKILQNVEAFGFFDDVVGQGQAIYHTAGALGKGERIWILAKLPNDLIIKGKDAVEKYLCLTTSHDGRSALRMYFTPVRVVCQNTLNWSMKDAKEGIAIRHIGDINSKIDEAQRVLGLALKYYVKFEEVAQHLADTQFTVAQADTYFDGIVFGKGDPKKIEERKKSTRAQNQKGVLTTLFDSGKGADIKEIRHTAWTAYNAVTEYADHHRSVHGLSKDPTMRLQSVWFGSSARLKQDALDDMLVLVGK